MSFRIAARVGASGFEVDGLAGAESSGALGFGLERWAGLGDEDVGEVVVAHFEDFRCGLDAALVAFAAVVIDRYTHRAPPGTL